ncbi:RNA-directed DNA polymerase from mobile element jockey [Aphis craccivora]|uniref:RNA-directed DNA polymerase from mobile element jockey n=1 Tax=Aphis craccivora TaxID=307492 RepID=A0A6G0YJG9_APHCR|nr:RNA-directed DNA polymerase from mobile element jockey [Aphis craccivora]
MNINILDNTCDVSKYLNILASSNFISCINNFTRITNVSKSCIEHTFINDISNLSSIKLGLQMDYYNTNYTSKKHKAPFDLTLKNHYIKYRNLLFIYYFTLIKKSHKETPINCIESSSTKSFLTDKIDILNELNN